MQFLEEVILVILSTEPSCSLRKMSLWEVCTKFFKSNAKQHVTKNIKNIFFVLIPILSAYVGFQNNVYRYVPISVTFGR